MKTIIGQSVKFIIVGVFNTVLSYFIYYICIRKLNLLMPLSLFISYVIGIINSYFCNKYWTFQARNMGFASTIVKFIGVYMINYVVNLAFLILLLNYFKVSDLLAQAIALSLTTIISYFGHKYISFRKKVDRGVEMHEYDWKGY